MVFCYYLVILLLQLTLQGFVQLHNSVNRYLCLNTEILRLLIQKYPKYQALDLSHLSDD